MLKRVLSVNARYIKNNSHLKRVLLSTMRPENDRSADDVQQKQRHALDTEAVEQSIITVESFDVPPSSITATIRSGYLSQG